MTGPRASILLVSGSTRRDSTNTAALRAIRSDTQNGASTVLLDVLAELPAFNPDDDRDPLPGSVSAMREAIAAADGVLFCTPEYAGALPGSFKNLLDWTVGGGEMDRKPAAWINVAAPGRGENAVASLETVLGYVGATIVEDACRRIEVGRDALDADGELRDPAARAAIAELMQVFLARIAQAS